VRQDLLMKCSTAGQFFHITDGGYVMNCADMLLARERKTMLKKAVALQKAKKDLHSYLEASAKASAVFKKLFSKWLVSDLKIAIQYKRGPFKGNDDTRLSGMGKKNLLAMYTTSKYKGKRRGVRSRGWTPKQEAKLNRLLRGDITSIKETAIYGQGLERQSEYLSIKLRTLSSQRRKDVLIKLFGELPEEEKADLVRELTGSPAVITDNEESVEFEDDDSTLFERESDSELEDSNQSKFTKEELRKKRWNQMRKKSWSRICWRKMMS
jgi:hypothetical protein